MLTERLLAVSSPVFLLCCNGGVEPYAPAPSDGAASVAPGQASDVVAHAPQRSAAATRGEGWLELSAAADVTSYLGSLHAVVKDANGHVVGGADEEVAAPEAATVRGLTLVLPAGDDYTVSLTAATTDAKPIACRATVVGLRIAAGSSARAQVFSWDCGGLSGYVPATLDGDCYWLADWSFVTRINAAIDELFDVGAAGHDLRGNVPTFSWSTASPDGGTFTDPAAARTSFRCRAADERLPLTVTLSTAGCEQQVTQTISCK